MNIEQARSELSNIAAQLAKEYPDTQQGHHGSVTPFAEQVIGQQIRILFWSLMGAVGFVLLIACANVANLLLARAADRSREIAVRVSIGATRSRIVRQLLVESVLLAFVSGIFGLGLAYAGYSMVRCQSSGCRETVLDGVHDGREGVRVLRRRVPVDRHHLRTCACAVCLEDQRQRSLERWRAGRLGGSCGHAAGPRA